MTELEAPAADIVDVAMMYWDDDSWSPVSEVEA